MDQPMQTSKELLRTTPGVAATDGDHIAVAAGNSARFLLVSGQPLNEPIARGGPFVMNTRAEVMQAFADYQNDQF